MVLLLVASAIVILIGQTDRELLSPDDLREVEVAREMYAGGDYVVPHLAGLPFVEKPPGFPAVVSFAYRIAGKPSAVAARMTATAFAFATLIAVFLLGWRILGIEGGAIAAGILAFSVRFCITAHEVLLDNALTASIAFTILFVWIALEEDIPRKKRTAYAAAGFSLGLSFLFKGFVGLAIFGSGFLFYLVLSKRFSELRHIFRPLPIVSFFVPVLSWTIPFILHAPSNLVWEFIYSNHFGRFISANYSHARPYYFYVIDIWPQFAPGSIFLPLAVWMAWKNRKEKDNQAGIFLLSLFIGPIILLSASIAKDSIYLLPVYPVMAMLVARCIMQQWLLARSASIFTWVISAVVILSVGIMVGITGYLEGTTIPVVASVIIFSLASTRCLYSIRRDNLHWTGIYIACLITIGWGLWFTGPIAEVDIAKKSIHKPMMEALSRVGNRDLVLYNPNDGIRGAASFYRNNTALEIRSPNELMKKLTDNPNNTVALIYKFDQNELQPLIFDAAKGTGKNLHIEGRFDLGKKPLFLVAELQVTKIMKHNPN